jgi:hypothetical protein
MFLPLKVVNIMVQLLYLSLFYQVYNTDIVSIICCHQVYDITVVDPEVDVHQSYKVLQASKRTSLSLTREVTSDMNHGLIKD